MGLLQIWFVLGTGGFVCTILSSRQHASGEDNCPSYEMAQLPVSSISRLESANS